MDDSNRQSRTVIIIFVIIVVILVILFIIFAYRYNPNANSSDNGTGNNCFTPAPPLNVVATSIETTKVKITWSAAAGSNKYKIYVGTIPDFNKQTAINSFLTADTQYTIDNLILGRIYYFFVVSFNDCAVESIKSTTVQGSSGYPARFRVQNRTNPNIALTISPDFQNIITGPLCTGNLGDNLCVWNFNQAENFIESDINNANCVKTFPILVDQRIKYGSCSDNSYYNYVAARQWNYTPLTGSLCNPENPEGTNCIKTLALSSGQDTIGTPYYETPEMKWDIVSL